jgi:DNA repair protein RadA/Sms
MYGCRSCDYRAAKWLGRCPQCSAWGSISERPLSQTRGVEPAQIHRFPEIEGRRDQRLSTGLGELDRVLGGGLVPGAVVLIAGEPGIGKSTLLLQAASAIADNDGPVLYVSGEESAVQLRGRGDRLAVRSDRLLVATETDVEIAIREARSRELSMMAVDSIQAVRCSDSDALPGSVTQLREAAMRLVEFAKSSSVPVVAVGHVTKEGAIAGPRALEHVVDTVVQFEGDRQHEHRILRALKNRFGSADELGVFRMTAGGLVGVDNPSEIFLTARDEDVQGTAVLAGIEGSRPLLVEVQALVGQPVQGSARRTCLGVEPSRMALVLAVLERRAGLNLAGRDVFVNVTGGLTISEPAADLAVAAAVASSALGRPLSRRTVLCGEIGLTGEVRAVSRADARQREALRLGFTSAIMPRGGPRDAGVQGIRRHAVDSIDEAFRLLFE